jgi:hypothetical protein
LQEIANGATETISLVIYSNGTKVNADGAVNLSIYNADAGLYASGTYTNTVLATASAYNDPAIGLYTYVVAPPLTSLDQVLQVTWSYSVNGISTSQNTFINVSTPYATVSDIVDYYGYGTTNNKQNFKSEKQISSAEKLARIAIDKYTQQKFGKRYGYQEVIAYGADALFLTEPMLSIDQMYENDWLLIDNTQNPPYDNFGYPIELTQTNKVVRIVNQDWNVIYDNQVDPTILYYGQFRNNVRYKFVGTIGWNYVPDDIKTAAMLLAGDYMSNDAAWRNRYLQQVSMSETSFTMSKGAFNGTGNVLVDSILDDYRDSNFVVI